MYFCVTFLLGVNIRRISTACVYFRYVSEYHDLVHFVERVLQHAHLPHVPEHCVCVISLVFAKILTACLFFVIFCCFFVSLWIVEFSFSYFAASGSSKTNWTLYSKSWHSIPKYLLWFTWCVEGELSNDQ